MNIGFFYCFHRGNDTKKDPSFIEKNARFLESFWTHFLRRDSFQKHEKFPSIQVIVSCMSKGSFLQLLIPDHKAVLIPEEDFHMGASAVEEEKESSRKQLSREELFYDSPQSFKALSHTDGFLTQKDARVGRQCDHGSSANKLKSCLRSFWLQSALMRIWTPRVCREIVSEQLRLSSVKLAFPRA